MSFLSEPLKHFLERLAIDVFGTMPFVVNGTLAVILICLICGAVGSQVIGNRMAFFGDSLAHCAWAGIALALLTILLAAIQSDAALMNATMLTVMIALGAIFGVGIAYVREKTALASDTVIGVFFAAALGIGALAFPALKRVTNREPETFLFGSVHNTEAIDLIRLFGLLVLTTVVLVLCYNQFVFASFNASLARSRRIPLRFLNYLFIVLLALVVNLVLNVVGVMLVTALLIVPAATASNLSRNMRQMFWWTIALSLAAGLLGLWVSLSVEVPMGRGLPPLELGAGGCIVVLSVLGFALSMFVAPWVRGRQTR
jgi:zinc transport system permease protein